MYANILQMQIETIQMQQWCNCSVLDAKTRAHL